MVFIVFNRIYSFQSVFVCWKVRILFFNFIFYISILGLNYIFNNIILNIILLFKK